MKFFNLTVEFEDKEINISQIHSVGPEYGNAFSLNFNTRTINKVPEQGIRFRTSMDSDSSWRYETMINEMYTNTMTRHSRFNQPITLGLEHGVEFGTRGIAVNPLEEVDTHIEREPIYYQRQRSRPAQPVISRHETDEMARRNAQRQRDLAARSERQDQPTQRHEHRRSAYQRLRNFFGGDE